MKDFTNEELDRLQALYEAATPGPWDATTSWPAYVSYAVHGNIHEKIMDQVYEPADAAFIAGLNPAVAAQLLAELRTLRAARHPAPAGAAEAEEWSKVVSRATAKGFDNYQQVAADMLLEVLADTKWPEQEQKVVDLLATVLAERDSDVRALAMELKRSTPPAATEAVEAPWRPVEQLPTHLFYEFVYVLLPDNSVTQALYKDFDTDELQEFDTDELQEYAWGHYTDIDVIEPLPVQPTHFCPPPTAPAPRSHG